MKLQSISPDEAQLLIAKGAQLIDIRSSDEFARERIAGARSMPMEKISTASLGGHHADTIIFYCKSGNRTKMNADALAAASMCEAFILEGGIESWKAAGNAVSKDAKQPLELNRQAQIIAGGFVFIGFVLGLAVDPAFYAVSGTVGAGLVFSGVTGTCATARLLKRMPWNRSAFV